MEATLSKKGSRKHVFILLQETSRVVFWHGPHECSRKSTRQCGDYFVYAQMSQERLKRPLLMTSSTLLQHPHNMQCQHLQQLCFIFLNYTSSLFVVTSTKAQTKVQTRSRISRAYFPSQIVESLPPQRLKAYERHIRVFWPSWASPPQWLLCRHSSQYGDSIF